MKLTLHRHTSTQNAVIGTLSVPGVPHPIWTIEDKWQNNRPRVSCIPDGDYRCEKFSGAKFKDVWEVKDVPGRSAILFHAGNTDADTVGCILVGLGVMKDALVESKAAVELMRKVIGKNGFDLQIISLGVL